jgi:hypothetical protein
MGIFRQQSAKQMKRIRDRGHFSVLRWRWLTLRARVQKITRQTATKTDEYCRWSLRKHTRATESAYSLLMYRRARVYCVNGLPCGVLSCFASLQQTDNSSQRVPGRLGAGPIARETEHGEQKQIRRAADFCRGLIPTVCANINTPTDLCPVSSSRLQRRQLRCSKGPPPGGQLPQQNTVFTR